MHFPSAAFTPMSIMHLSAASSCSSVHESCLSPRGVPALACRVRLWSVTARLQLTLAALYTLEGWQARDACRRCPYPYHALSSGIHLQYDSQGSPLAGCGAKRPRRSKEVASQSFVTGVQRRVSARLEPRSARTAQRQTSAAKKNPMVPSSVPGHYLTVN